MGYLGWALLAWGASMLFAEPAAATSSGGAADPSATPPNTPTPPAAPDEIEGDRETVPAVEQQS